MKCDICGREISRVCHLGGYKLCSKHMHQLLNHGKFLDHNPRTQNDPNEYHVEGDITKIDLYDGVNCNKTGEFIIAKG